MNQNVFIDVTRIEPRLKHPAIFDAFDSLAEGDTILLHNDHDPKPLYYQLLGERGNSFSWNYKVQGPEVWEVEIAKNLRAEKKETIGEIVAGDMRKADVFKRYGIDFCCGGKKTLAAVCADKGFDITVIRQELAKAEASRIPSVQQNYNEWPVSFLADYVVNIHHAYIRSNAPILNELSKKVAGRHGDKHPELNAIRDKVDEALCELNVHMKKEENILFPYIKQVESSVKNKENIPTGFNSVMQPISVMEHDHDIVGELFREVNKLSDNYSAPENSCNSYKFLYHKLAEFENDLHTHIHLENNILFPRAISMEAPVNK